VKCEEFPPRACGGPFAIDTLIQVTTMISSALALAATVACLAAEPQGSAATSNGRFAAAVSHGSNVSAAPPPGYTIGPDDRLKIAFWKNTELTADVVVRPDGRISLPLLNDIEAAGLTPEQLREKLLESARRFFEDATATVIVTEIRSRRVFISGNVEKPGPYPLNDTTTVLQLIATAGGLREFVSGKNIVVLRGSGDSQRRYKFNYQDVIAGKNLRQNLALQPGDTVIVP
jgi:polysaccharide export outer membrane protein